MDEATKFILNQLNDNITILREETHQRLDNIEKKINEKIVTKEFCDNKRKETMYKTGVKKEELSYKKITVICTTISGVVAAIITLVSNLFK